MSQGRRAVTVATVAIVGVCLASCSATPTEESSGDVALSVQDYYSADPLMSVFDEIYQSCGAEIGATVTANHVPGNNLIATVLQQASSDTLPDVLALDNPNIPQIAATGALSPLSDYDVPTEGIADSVLEVGSYEGELYGLAPAVNSLGLFYNLDMLAAAGIDAPPTTWDELRETAAALTQDGQYGFALGAQPNTGDAWSFLPFMWTNGGDESDLTTEPTVEALQLLVDLVNDGSMPTSVVNWQQGDVSNEFSAGRIAMMVNGNWNIKPFQQTDLNWATTTIPTPAAGQSAQSPLGGEAFTVPITGDSTKMAKAGELVTCVTNAENQQKIAEASGNIPSLTAVAEEFAASDDQVAPFLEIVANARSRTAQLGADWPTAAEAIYTAEGLAFTGQADAATALERAQSE